MAVTAKLKRFVAEYLIDVNATQAATWAGYAHPTKQSPRFLEKVGVEKLIAKRLAKQDKQAEVKADDVIRELAKNGFANMADYLQISPDGKVASKTVRVRKQGSPLW